MRDKITKTFICKHSLVHSRTKDILKELPNYKLKNVHYIPTNKSDYVMVLLILELKEENLYEVSK